MWNLVVECALASGFAVGEPGVAQLGRGGAWVVRADDPTAAWADPAALAGLAREPHLEVQVLAAGAAFTPEGGPMVTTGSHLTAIPNLVVPIPRTPLWIAAGPPLTGATWSWPADGPQRYTVIEQSVIASDALVAWGGSHRWLDVGLSVGLTAIDLHEQQVITTALDGSLDPAYDVVSTINARGAAPALVVSARARGPVGFAVTVRAPGSAHLRGSLTSDFRDNTFFTGSSPFGQLITEPTSTDDRVTVPLTLPATARVGINLERETWDLEVDLGIDDWSRSREIRVTDVDLVIPTAAADDPVVTEDIVVPLGMKRSYTACLGGEWRPAPGRAVRLGLGFASASSPPNNRSALVPDGDRYWLGVGGRSSSSATRGPMRGQQVAWALSPQIVRAPNNPSSVVAQVAIDPLSGAVGYGERVGNGQLDAWSVSFGVSLSRAR